MPDEEPGPNRKISATRRIAAAFAVALAFAFGCYALLEAARPSEGLVSVSFLLLLPAAICAFVCYLADPFGTRSRGAYLRVPVILLVLVIAASAIFLREGIICILMLSPLWLISGLLGAWSAYAVRNRLQRNRSYSLAILAIPLIAMQIEPLLPVPARTATVTRSMVIAAQPARVWPLLRGIPDVHPGEGAWNLSQDVLGIPRPLGARLLGNGVGAVRLANWGEHVHFREWITQWAPMHRIGWRFDFSDIAGWAFTDRHLMPNSRYFRVIDGGYTLIALPDGRTEVVLKTRYWMRTPVNAYAELWGQVFLGDLEDNLLALLRQRAEKGSTPVRRTDPAALAQT